MATRTEKERENERRQISANYERQHQTVSHREANTAKTVNDTRTESNYGKTQTADTESPAGNEQSIAAKYARQHQTTRQKSYQVNTDDLVGKSGRYWLAEITKIGQQDKETGRKLYNLYEQARADESSPLYDPYATATNKNPKNIAKNAAQTEKAKTEWNNLQKELAYWAQSDRNYSDDEIIGRVNWKNYPTLAKMDADRAGTGTTVYLNEPIGYDKDAMYGVLWAARNPDMATGNTTTDAVMSALGRGNQYQRDEEKAARLDPSSKEYNPYLVGSTMDSQLQAYGVNGFGADWLDSNLQYRGTENYTKVYKAEQTTKKAEQELNELNQRLDDWLSQGLTADEVFTDDLLDDYNTLEKLQTSIENGSIIDTTRSIGYDKNAMQQAYQEAYTKRYGVKSNQQYAEDTAAAMGAAVQKNEAQTMVDDAADKKQQEMYSAIRGSGTKAEQDSVKAGTGTAGYNRTVSQMEESIQTGTAGAEGTLASKRLTVAQKTTPDYFTAMDSVQYGEKIKDSYSDELKAILEKAGVDSKEEDYTRKVSDALAQKAAEGDQEAQMMLNDWNTSGIIEYQEKQDLFEEADANKALLEEIDQQWKDAFGDDTPEYRAHVNTMKSIYSFKNAPKADWSAYDLTTLLTQQGAGDTDQTVSAAKELNQQKIQYIDQLLESAESFGAPKSYVDNMKATREQLERANSLIESHEWKKNGDYAQSVEAFDASEINTNFWTMSGGDEEIVAAIKDPEAADSFLKSPVNTANGGIALSKTSPDLFYTAEMTEEERNNFKYQYTVGGQEAAMAYYEDLRPMLSARYAAGESEAAQELGEKLPISSTVISILGSLTQIEGAVYTNLMALAGKQADPNSMAFSSNRMISGVREGAKERGDEIIESVIGDSEFAKKAFHFLYDGLVSSGDSLISAYAGNVIPVFGTGKVAETIAKNAGLTMMSAVAASNTMQEALLKGADSTQATYAGLASGLAEALTEKIPFENITKAYDAGSNGGKIMKMLADELIEEGLGEGLSEYLGAAGDYLVMGEDSDFITSVDQYMEDGYTKEDAIRKVVTELNTQALYATMAGAFSGTISVGSSYVVGKLAEKAEVAKAKKSLNEQENNKQTNTEESNKTETENDEVNHIADNAKAETQNIDNIKKQSVANKVTEVPKSFDANLDEKSVYDVKIDNAEIASTQETKQGKNSDNKSFTKDEKTVIKSYREDIANKKNELEACTKALDKAKRELNTAEERLNDIPQGKTKNNIAKEWENTYKLQVEWKKKYEEKVEAVKKRDTLMKSKAEIQEDIFFAQKDSNSEMDLSIEKSRNESDYNYIKERLSSEETKLNDSKNELDDAEGKLEEFKKNNLNKLEEAKQRKEQIKKQIVQEEQIVDDQKQNRKELQNELHRLEEEKKGIKEAIPEIVAKAKKALGEEYQKIEKERKELLQRRNKIDVRIAEIEKNIEETKTIGENAYNIAHTLNNENTLNNNKISKLEHDFSLLEEHVNDKRKTKEYFERNVQDLKSEEEQTARKAKEITEKEKMLEEQSASKAQEVKKKKEKIQEINDEIEKISKSISDLDKSQKEMYSIFSEEVSPLMRADKENKTRQEAENDFLYKKSKVNEAELNLDIASGRMEMAFADVEKARKRYGEKIAEAILSEQDPFAQKPLSQEENATSNALTALYTAQQNGVGETQQTASVDAALRSFGVEPEASVAVSKRIIETGSIGKVTSILEAAADRQKAAQATSMALLSPNSETAATFADLNGKITAEDVNGLTMMYELDRQDDGAMGAYEAAVEESQMADDTMAALGQMDTGKLEGASEKVDKAKQTSDQSKAKLDAANAGLESAQASLETARQRRAENLNPDTIAAESKALQQYAKAQETQTAAEAQYKADIKALEDAKGKMAQVQGEAALQARAVALEQQRARQEQKVAAQEQTIPDGEVQNSKNVDQTAGNISTSNGNKANYQKMSSMLIKGMQSKASSTNVAYALQEAFSGPKEQVQEKLRQIVRDVAENSVSKDSEYAQMKEYLKGTKFSLNEGQKAEVRYALGKYGDYTKQLFKHGLYASDSANISLDSLWHDLSDIFPEYFSPDTSDADMPMALLNWFDQSKEQAGKAWQSDELTNTAVKLLMDKYSEMTGESLQAEENHAESNESGNELWFAFHPQTVGTNNQTGVGSKKVTSPVDTAKTLAKELKVGQDIGSRKVPRGVLGYYDAQAKYLAVRSTEAGNISTTFHELGHVLSDKLGMTGTMQMVNALDPVFAKDYSANALPGEAFAEFVWRYMTDDASAQAFAGDVFLYDFERALKQNGLDKQVHKARNQMHEYVNATVNQRIGAVVKDRSETPSSSLKEIRTKLTDMLVDNTAVMENVNNIVREQTGKTDVRMGENLRNTALMRNTASRRAYNILTDSLTDSNWQIIGDGLAKRFENAGIAGKDFDLLNNYMLALHSLDRDAAGKPVFDSSMTKAQRDAYIQDVQQNHPEVARAEQEFQQFRNEFLQAFLVDTGYMTQETLDLFNKMYPHYVPTFRMKDGKGSGSGTSGKSFTVKRAKGSTENIYNPMDSFVQMMDSIVNMVSQNNTALVWDNVYHQYEGLGLYGREVTQDIKSESVDTTGLQEKIRKILTNANTDTDVMDQVLDTIGTEQVQWKGTGSVNLPNILTVQKADGSKAYYEIFDTELYKALSNYKESAGQVWQLIGKGTKAMSALTTGSNPVFAIRNFMRDFQKSVTYGSWASNYVTGAGKWLRAAWDVWREKGEYGDYKAIGGGGWNRIESGNKKGAEAYRSDLFKGYNTSNIGRTAKWAGQKLWNAVTFARLNEVVEQTSRYAEYRYGKQDKSTAEGKQQAFLNAQEATVDFSRSGYSNIASDLKQVIPFLGASTQGIYQTGREFTTKAERSRLPTRFAKTVINTALASVLANLLVFKHTDDDDKEEYAMLSDELLADNFFVPNPSTEIFGEAPYLRIPIGQDPIMRAVHGAVTNALWSGNADEPLIETAAIAQNLLDGFNPVNGTIFDAAIATSTNKNWYGSKIVPDRMDGWDPTTQYTEETADIFVNASRWLDGATGVGVSPMMIQYLAEQYSGFLGQMAIPAISKDKYTGELGGVKAAIAAVRKRLTSDPLKSNGITSSFYDGISELQEVTYAAKNDRPLNMLRRGLTEDEARAAVDEAKALTGTSGVLGQAKKFLTEGYAKIDEIEARTDLTDHEKYLMTSEVRREMMENTLDAQEVIGEYKAKYIDGENILFRMLEGVHGRESTEFEKLPERYQTAYEAGDMYMQRAYDAWETSGKSSALPHASYTFSDDKVKYEVAEEDREQFDDIYQSAYKQYVDKNASERRWERMTADEKLEVMQKAHEKAQAEAKKWWLKKKK